MRTEICPTNIRSLGFRDIRECVTLWGLILRSLGVFPIDQLYSVILPPYYDYNVHNTPFVGTLCHVLEAIQAPKW
jgi:hypothetical protein